MEKSQERAVQKFFDEFSKKVSDKVISLEMVSLKADLKTLNSLSLKNNNPSCEIWGLLVFCEKNFYFYVHPYESAMSMMLRQAAHGDEPEEQLANVSELKSLSVQKTSRTWFSILLGEKEKIFLFFEGEDGLQKRIELETQHKADNIIEKISNYIKK